MINMVDGKIVYVIENITYYKEEHMISGTSVEGPYLGEVEIYLPFFVSGNDLEDGICVRAYCGEGMTMSLPPQLMGCTKVEVINK